MKKTEQASTLATPNTPANTDTNSTLLELALKQTELELRLLVLKGDASVAQLADIAARRSTLKDLRIQELQEQLNTFATMRKAV